MNQDYYFPLFGLFATAGKIFLLSEGGGEQSDKADPEKYARQRRGRFSRLTPAAACRHWQRLGLSVTLQQNSSPGGRTAEWGGNAGIEKGGCPAGRKGNGKV